MNIGFLARQHRSTFAQPRSSPISRAAGVASLGLAIVGMAASLATQFTFASLPNIWPLVAGVVVLEVLGRLLPQVQIVDAIQTVAHGLLFLVMICLGAVLAAYAMQRFAFPLQDRLFGSIDEAFGLSWPNYAHWVDGHLAMQRLFHFAYKSIQIQIALPLVVLALSNRRFEVRAYLLAFAIALSVTIVISALLPAAGPIIAVDRASFEVLGFTGATPLDHLTRLREAGPFILNEPPGGIATFPSFHATVAVLTPLTLRKHCRILLVLLVLDAAMLGGTVTEGAHYFCDVLAGSAMAFFAHAVATSIIRMEDRSLLNIERGIGESTVPAGTSVQSILP
jgi:hypothetical protein